MTPNSPADKTGIKVNDQLININNQPLTEAEKLPIITPSKTLAKKSQLNIGVMAKNRRLTSRLNDEKTVKTGGYLEVVPNQAEKIYSTWSAPIMGVATTGQSVIQKRSKALVYYWQKQGHGSIGQIFGSRRIKKNRQELIWPLSAGA
ncbi:PDZ domain-containing protein [Candidatus Minimicrobia naudis]